MTMSALPARMMSAAMAMVWEPELQKRLIVAAGTEVGKPAAKTTSRATFIPCSPSGMAQPSRTSSTIGGLRPGVRCTRALIISDVKYSGRVSRRLPFLALPMAVRAVDTMTASRIVILLSQFRSGLLLTSM